MFRSLSSSIRFTQQFSMLVAPAVERNKQPILEVLKKYYSKDFNGRVLEIASGTGGHVIHFAQYFTSATFQPSEVTPRSLHSIVAYVDHYQLENVRVPLYIDCSLPPDKWALPADYSPESVDLILNINMIHISSNAAVSGLFKAANGLLKPGGRLITYGPYGVDGQIAPESNVAFDQNLRSQNAEWGLRQIDEVIVEAERNSLRFVEKHSMPANNHVLVFVKNE
ncbi:hypothetical protein M3Y98_00864200 [Aphelenchoides besseyi]|nr:hypothetical protein M3Y98_00864200 [Aphelenchoides besseyi]KAI6211213.1 hypothetical protein M3Y96_00409900 [Aphelenchoides besseyi]